MRFWRTGLSAVVVVVLGTAVLSGCKRPIPKPAPVPESEPEAVQPAPPTPVPSMRAPKVTPRPTPPVTVPGVETPNPWFQFQPLQRTLTRSEFETKLRQLYDPFGAMPAYMELSDQKAVFYISPKHRDTPVFTLEFAPDDASRVPTPRVFRTPAEIRALPKPPGKPLNGLRIAIDPGHIGGKWAQVENRSTRYRGSAPVNEGDLNLITAAILKRTLTELGATVYVVRESTEPVTPYRPSDFREMARQLLLSRNPKLAAKLQGKTPEQQDVALGKKKVNDVSDFLFYRASEIPERGNRIRVNFDPDVTLTLYLNATPSSGRGRLTPINRNIIFVHGSYTKEEVAQAEQRRQLIGKLLENSTTVEVEVAGAIGEAFREKTGFPPVLYGDSKTTRMVIPGNKYVVARNLAANRCYPGPVVCTEPYFMNQKVTYRRLLAGDYEGTRLFDGKPYRSIFREYAEAVTDGLIRAYSNELPPAAPEPSVAVTSPH